MSDEPDDEPLSDLAEELRENADRRSAADDRSDDGERSTDGDGRSTGDGRPTGGDSAGRDPSDSAGPPGDAGLSPFDEPGPDAPGDAAPLSDLADEVARQRDADPEDDEDPFEAMNAPEIDAEQLWERLVAGDDETVVFSERVEADVDRDIRVIPKRTCERCPHFTDPPEVGCTHDGTDILELVDVDHHKVADCPMVVDEEVIRAGFEDEL